ncbi:MAG: hypothetical protein WAL30_00850 [Candidatus Aquirickettsiella sp.]
MPTKPKNEKMSRSERVLKEILKLQYQGLLTDISAGTVGASPILADTNRALGSNYIVTKNENVRKTFRHLRYDDKKDDYKKELSELVSKLQGLPSTCNKDSEITGLDTEIKNLSDLISSLDKINHTNTDSFILHINETIKKLSDLINNKEQVKNVAGLDASIKEIDNEINSIEKFFDFKNIAEFSQFIKKHLFYEVKDSVPITLFLYAHHQGGFPNVDATVIQEMSSHYNRVDGGLKDNGILFTQASSRIVDFIPVADGNLQIRQFNTFDVAKNSDAAPVFPEQQNKHHFEIESIITLRIKDNVLEATVDKVKFACASKLAKAEFSENRLYKYLANKDPAININWFFSFLIYKIQSFFKEMLGKIDKKNNALIVQLPANWQAQAEENGDFKTTNKVENVSSSIITQADKSNSNLNNIVNYGSLFDSGDSKDNIIDRATQGSKFRVSISNNI